jgi:hypothetical protein
MVKSQLFRNTLGNKWLKLGTMKASSLKHEIDHKLILICIKVQMVKYSITELNIHDSFK